MKTLLGKPLLQWTIEAARKATTIDRVYVSTDSDVYGHFAEQHGAIYIRRPAPLAEDVPTEQVIIHALQSILGFHADVTPIVTLQCTTPFTKSEDIDDAVSLYQRGVYGSVLAITHIREHPEWMFEIHGNQLNAREVMTEDLRGDWGVRQSLPPLYRVNGGIYVTNTEQLLKQRQLIIAPIGYVYMPWAQSWEIDEPIDLVVGEALAKHEQEAHDQSRSQGRETATQIR
jgi:CMP-N-acetylneuraminic acid synthetase